jgi:hypothetical protein
MVLEECMNIGNKNVVRKWGTALNLQATRHVPCGVLRRFRGMIDSIHQRTDLVVKTLPFVGQSNGTRMSVKKPDAELLFQTRNRATDS